MKNKAFTLIELLVVIAIVGILSSVIYTNITGLRDRAKVTAGIRFDSSVLHSIGDLLVGEWTFDLLANPLADTSGSGNNAATTSVGTSPTYYSTGGYNNKGYFDFDGTDDHIKILSVGSMNIVGDMTISVWVYPESGDHAVIHKDRIYSLRINTDGTITWANYGDWLYTHFGNYGNISFNKWHHIAVTREGSNTAIYLDGSQIVKKSFGLPIISSSTFITTLGCYSNGSSCTGAYLNGYMDDVRIYSSALSGSDIQKLYASELPSHPNLASK
ncbi:MAG: LamG-like jellyroll fold domain-containing protein [Candidatus Paceibacterota bacterium]|jgi:prepilin-type N-terminal cleavage/methylation domain-containing protein